ncbi:hypothetical protein [Xanthomonas nasturtii]|uniref:hypothetical protein n=1 Tax=Xanthomonas nasturtii TaxID=1843581 RepID=UPI0015F27572|nr:hypothetical protein [Xanthomonas nasturtii]MCL1528965.1 hypothetical protein [Xanthomonas nasturtii]MCL1564101.1 hypothetical protein [Xanthomonas nasturtii]
MLRARSARLLRSLAILAALLLVLSPVLSHLSRSQRHNQAPGLATTAPVSARVQPSGAAAGLPFAHSANAGGDASTERGSDHSAPADEGTASTCEACQPAERVLLVLLVAALILLPAMRSSVRGRPALAGLSASSQREAHPPRGPPLAAIG